MENTIYGLVDPRTGMLRYVGITKVSLDRRRRRHIKAARNSSSLPVHVWTRKLLCLGIEPIAVHIEETGNRDREIFWIAHYRSAGLRLLNCTRGGDGLVCPTQETRRKMSESHKGHVPTPAARAALSASKRGKKRSEEFRQKMKKPKSEQHRLNAAAGVRAARDSGRYRVLRGDENPMRQHPESVLRGSKNPRARLTEDQVLDIRARYVPYKFGTVQLSKEYGVSQATVWNIVKAKSWRHLL